MTKNNSFASRTTSYNSHEPVLNEQGVSSQLSKKGNSRFNVSQAFFEEESELNPIDLNSEMEEAQELKKQHDKRVKREKGLLSEKTIDRLFIAGCIYFVILTFGVCVTNYTYDTNGKIVPLQMTYQDLEKKEAFEVLLDQYLLCRDLYEEVLGIDKRLASGDVQPLTLAPEYEALVSKAESLYTKTDALSLNAQYEQIRTMLLKWLETDFATYCKNMSIAISQNNSANAEAALINRQSTYSDFSLITQNIVAMGDLINGVDMVNVKEWDGANIYK